MVCELEVNHGASLLGALTKMLLLAAVGTTLAACGASSTGSSSKAEPLGLAAPKGSIATDTARSADGFAPRSLSNTAPLSRPDVVASAERATYVAPSGAPAATPSSAAAQSIGGYKIGAQDVLEITVFKVSELSKSVQVSEDGAINLPLVGDVVAAGHTAQEVARDVAAKLGAKYLKDPQVTVYVKEFNSQRITVEGAIKKPGVYPLKGKLTLMQAVAMSEGVDANVAGSTVRVFRQSGGKKSALTYDLNEILTGASPDPGLNNGDLVVVETSDGKVAFNNFTKVIPAATLFKPF